jgi:hypothetical protein
MRAFLVATVLGLLAASSPASACPRGTACIATRTHDAIAVATAMPAPAARPSLVLRARTVDDTVAPSLARSLRAHKPAPARAVEMPAVWQSLRSAVYRQMPKYEERTFTLVAAPVVIDGAFDTVPGVGLAGAF